MITLMQRKATKLASVKIEFQLKIELSECVKIATQSAPDEECTKRVNESGGITCCVPQYCNNLKRHYNLPFYVKPTDEKLKKL